ncbi:MAG: 50S ribosomal protein L35 [Fervidobacterium sp.]|uniref:Large ribosomal subunit protein bL35 n=1 Tax=Fervidobacterium gondwanense DSM 13020 TaxID=1121883 RepID=A0A1M7S6J5_FERGO|nr:50S ribosomal protein L35 [Fervidobacterium gondwanense]UXF00871.1 50S ribosomal protein L35 [Fervidobacterium riparium]SHN54043.1 LSU ribosomal protein L35P [Fervidobacterium gondwanense DSM 13020]
MAKQKMKTSKTAAKRFKVTKNGKIMRRHANAWHKTGKKRRSTLRALRLEDVVASSDSSRILRLLGKK